MGRIACSIVSCLHRWGTTLFYQLLKTMQDHGHSKAVGDTGIVQKDMINMYRRFGFDLSKKLLNWSKVA